MNNLPFFTALESGVPEVLLPVISAVVFVLFAVIIAAMSRFKKCPSD